MDAQYQITTKKLNKVRSLLPVGSIEKIADELKLNLNTVRNVFLGRNKKHCHVVLSQALLIIENDKKQKEDLLTKIEDL